MNSPLPPQRSELRKTLRSTRRKLSPSDRQKKSHLITQYFINLPVFAKAKSIGFYWPTDEEVDTRFAIAQSQDKNCFLPVINKAGWRSDPLLFAGYQPGKTPLLPNTYKILEPVSRPGQGLSGKQLDLVVVPLVGFNRRCERIGMGKGYYDRTFASLRTRYRQTCLVGFAFDCQSAEFDANTLDVPMSVIVTESGTLFRQGTTRHTDNPAPLRVKS